MIDEPARSPLVEIERRVQARAKDLHLDLRTTVDRAALHDLVKLEISAWASEYQRGLRPYDLSNHEVVADRVMRNLAGYGPLEPLRAPTPPPNATPQRRHPTRNGARPDATRNAPRSAASNPWCSVVWDSRIGRRVMGRG